MSLLRRRPRPPGPPPAPAVHAAPVPSKAAPRPPELPAQLLRRLEFKVVRRLDGFLFGDYRGLFYGPSLDLAEVREYQPGDEVRRIDWNVTARSGRLHVRQYREERELTAWLLIDTSASMNFGTRRTLKRDLAREFAGVAALIVTRHGDKIGAVAFGPLAGTVPPRGGRFQALNVLRMLSGEAGSGKVGASPVLPAEGSPLEEALNAAHRTLRRRSLVFVVSDFLEGTGGGFSGSGGDPQGGRAGTGWTRALGRLAQRHDVVAVRVSDPAERVLPDVGGLRLRDPETGQELWLDTSDPQVRAAHARLVAGRDRALRWALGAAGADLLDLGTERELVGPLLRFAAARRGRRA